MRLTPLGIPAEKRAGPGGRTAPAVGVLLGVLLVAWSILVAPLQAEESDTGFEARLEALEQRIQQQQGEFEAQRERMEQTIREQQRELDAQQRQLSAQYELIQKLQAEQQEWHSSK